ncbi:DUF1871 family protein [Aureibacillus halotolerans]|uniref:Uncharacterized protein DUF1871 n=1 Tax=Aureibacillus halotolerans TaxID=1508390 RepID=A0A4R6U6C3_9BACI|nr:DUF1871 family protein [Aureibacillus halotolerans]TDQ40413.1 uncharacterized protein DUF1871 [Aureibacillus halotolerans]
MFQELVIEKLKQWDPFLLGEDFYETEPVDVLQELMSSANEKMLANKIQFIYAQSFDEDIPLEKCQMIASELIVLKEASSCERM